MIQLEQAIMIALIQQRQHYRRRNEWLISLHQIYVEQVNSLINSLDNLLSIKDSLQGQLEGEIDALKSELTASLSVLEADIKGLIPELPDIPDISLISQIQGFHALPIASPQV